jgi:hypothetical protein
MTVLESCYIRIKFKILFENKRNRAASGRSALFCVYSYFSITLPSAGMGWFFSMLAKWNKL